MKDFELTLDILEEKTNNIGSTVKKISDLVDDYKDEITDDYDLPDLDLAKISEKKVFTLKIKDVENFIELALILLDSGYKISKLGDLITIEEDREVFY